MENNTKHHLVDNLCAIAEELELSLTRGYTLRSNIAVELRDIIDSIRDNMFSIDQLSPIPQQLHPDQSSPVSPSPDRSPIKTLYDDLDKCDEQNVRQRCNGGDHSRKAGFSVRVMKACIDNNIETVGDLIRYGRRRFRAIDGIGTVIIDTIDHILHTKYQVQYW